MALLYGESTWEAYESFARGILAERDRLGRIVDNALSGLAVAATATGRPDESERLFDAYEAALIERGDEHSARTQGQSRGWGLYLIGDLAGAEPVYRRSWEALGELGERGFRSTLGGLFALDLLELGRRKEAEAVLDEAEALGSEDDWLTDACVAVVRARLASLDGRHDDAVGAAKRAAELGDAGYFMLRPWFKTEYGRTLAAAGRDDEARDALEEAIRLARVKGSTLFERRAQDVLEGFGY
jgi:tetratricopeptide (TPR) repeat protein